MTYPHPRDRRTPPPSPPLPPFVHLSSWEVDLDQSVACLVHSVRWSGWLGWSSRYIHSPLQPITAHYSPMQSCAAQNSTLALSTAKNSPGHQALLCRIQLFVSSFSALSSLKSYTGRQLGYHALCPWFSFQFQSCRPFSNNLFLFFLLFNRR